MTFAKALARISCGAILTSAVAVGGCSTMARAPVAPETVAFTCDLPTVTALAETKEYQVKGDVGISVAATSFECNRTTQTSETEVEPSLADSLFLPVQPSVYWSVNKKVEAVTQPAFELSPEKLTFRVKINNQGTRVFRGTGTVVLFNVSGKNLSVERANYARLVDVIVPPRTEQEVTIEGPAFSQLGTESTTMALSLFDVATKTDAAGNITQKQNFEWLYSYSVETKQDVGTVTRTSKVKPRGR